MWVEKNHGDQVADFIAKQVERLALERDDGGVAMWRVIADRFEQLRNIPSTDAAS